MLGVGGVLEEDAQSLQVVDTDGLAQTLAGGQQFDDVLVDCPDGLELDVSNAELDGSPQDGSAGLETGGGGGLECRLGLLPVQTLFEDGGPENGLVHLVEALVIEPAGIATPSEQQFEI